MRSITNRARGQAARMSVVFRDALGRQHGPTPWPPVIQAAQGVISVAIKSLSQFQASLQRLKFWRDIAGDADAKVAVIL